MRSSVAFALTFAGATQAYLINGDNVNCRSGPNTGSSIVRTYNKGHDVTLTCQTHGESINNDSLWDKTTDGCYVADWYVETHTGNMVVGECNAKAYPINGDNVNCRSGANTQSSVVRQYNKGDMVTLTCQTEGESINNDKLWDKTTDNCYVADWYVQTNTGNMVVGACNGGGNPPPPTGGNLPTLNGVQSRNANGIIAEVKRRNLGRQGCLAAITTGLTEVRTQKSPSKDADGLVYTPEIILTFDIVWYQNPCQQRRALVVELRSRRPRLRSRQCRYLPATRQVLHQHSMRHDSRLLRRIIPG